MIKEHRRTFKLLRLAFDLALVVGAYYALYAGVRLDVNPFGLAIAYHPDYHFRVPGFLAVCWGFAFIASGVYEQNTRATGGFASARVALKLLLIMMAAFALGLFAFKVQFLSRKFLLVYGACCFLLLALSKWSEFRVLQALRRMGFNTRSVLLVGDGEELSWVYDIFHHHPEWGYRVAGGLGLAHGLTKKKGGLRPLGSLKDLEEVLRTRIVDELVFAAPSGNSKYMREAMETAQLAGVPFRVMLNLALDPDATVVEAMGGKATLVTNPDRRNPYLRLVKRAMDFGGAFVATALLSPFLLLTAIAILATMGRPVFFLQKRAGLRGRVFFLIKFRTMIPEARKAQQELMEKNEMGGPVFKVKDDPRITRLGRFLRKYSIDELPQFFNVLKGDISLVGPRPLANYEARRVPHWARRRYSVMPGITCWWQVMGRNKLTFEEWMKLDLKYIDEWSLASDFEILAKTLPAVVFGKGAY